MDSLADIRISSLETSRQPVAESELKRFAERLDYFFTDLLRSVAERPVPVVALAKQPN